MPKRSPPPRPAAKPKPTCDFCKKPCSKAVVRKKHGTFCSLEHDRAAARELRKRVHAAVAETRESVALAIPERGPALTPAEAREREAQRTILSAWFEKKRPDTIASYKTSLRHFAQWLRAERFSRNEDDIRCVVEAMNCSEQVATARMERWIAAQEEAVRVTARTKNPRRLSGIKARVSGVRSFLKALKRAGMVAVVPEAQAPRVPKKSPVERLAAYEGVPEAFDTIVTGLDELADADEPELTDLRDWALVRLVAGRGLRRIELVDLALSDVDVPGLRIRILGKGRREHEWVDLAPEVMEPLQRWLVACRGVAVDRVFFGSSKKARPATKRMRRDNINRMLRHRARQFGTKLTPHDLRRIFCTESIDQLGERKALEVTRHASTETLGLYDLRQGREIRAAAQSVGASIARRGKKA